MSMLRFKGAVEHHPENILIDPGDLKGMCEIMDKYHNLGSMVVGENQLGEMTSASIYHDKIIVSTYQSNHWLRQNTYHRDGTCEETYAGRY